MSEPREAVIRAVDLTRRFGDLVALDHLTLDVRRGEVFGLLGPDGAGKTTALRLLSALMDPTEGEAWVAGHHAQREPEAVKDRIGYMAQRFGLYSDLTVDENMEFYAALFGISSSHRATMSEQLLQMTRMEPFRRRQAGKLSGGMKQKLALMCTLLHRPEILLLDEPTNGVDPVSRRDFWIILHELVREGLTVLVTTAYLDEAERCDRVGLLHRGRLIRCDAPDTMRRGFEEACFEVQCENQRGARAFLGGLPGVIAVESAGPVLHLFLDRETGDPRAIRQALDGAGYGPASLASIEPSLEDLFIRLLRRKAEVEGRGAFQVDWNP